jgi:hypothetical protein
MQTCDLKILSEVIVVENILEALLLLDVPKFIAKVAEILLPNLLDDV